MSGALLRPREAERLQQRPGLARIERRAPRVFGAFGSRTAAAILGGAQHLAKLRCDQCTMAYDFGLEARVRRRTLAATHPRRQRTSSRVASGQHVSLQRGDDLQLVFDVAQEEVGGCEFARTAGIEVAQCAETLERRERAGGAQARIAPAINQDERLHDEFQFANSTVTELDVAGDQVGRAQLALDLKLHRAQLAQRVEVEVAAIDEVAELAEQPFADLEHAGYRTRAEQRGPFPGLAEALVEAERAFKWSHQRRVSAAWTQSHVHPKTSRRQKFGQRFAQARHRFGVGVRPVEDVNQIDIRAEVEFLRAELAHRQVRRTLRPRAPCAPR